jgi:hypothetical protein
MPWDDDTPNPGSSIAKQQGCLCPVIDNGRGHRAPRPGGNWVVRLDCPMHSPSEEKTTDV